VGGGVVGQGLPAAGVVDRGGVGPAGAGEEVLDELPFGHVEAGVLGAEAFGQLADDVVVGADVGKGVEDLPADLKAGVARGVVDVVVLEEHGGGEQDVGLLRRLGHELLLAGDEEVVPGEALVDLVQLGRDAHRVGVLDEEGGDPGAALQVVRIVHQDRADAGLVEEAGRRVHDVEALDRRFVPVVEVAHVVEAAAALGLPGALDDGQAGGGVHDGGTVAGPGEAEAEANPGGPGAAVEPGERLDLLDR
jgi:hypothetical protein